MAERELSIQTQIVNSVRQDKGYARKVSHKFSVGIPDLFIGLAPFVAGYHEVKDFGEVGDKFDRQIETTPKQRYELKLLHDAYTGATTPYTPHNKVCSVLVHFVQYRRHFLAIQRHDVFRLTSDHPRDLVVERAVGAYFPMAQLFEAFGIAKVRDM